MVAGGPVPICRQEICNQHNGVDWAVQLSFVHLKNATFQIQM